jgi:transposase-like protein
MDSNNHRGLTQRHGLVESRMLGNGHVRFGGRAEETDQPKDRHRASARPNTYVKVAGHWTYVYRAVDQHRQVIDVLVSSRRDAAAARAFFARAQRFGPVPVEVVTDRAPVYPRVLDELAPAARHVTERYANNSIESDHGRLKARLRPMRGLKCLASARISQLGRRSCRTCAAATTQSPPIYRRIIGSASRSTSSL